MSNPAVAPVPPPTCDLLSRSRERGPVADWTCCVCAGGPAVELAKVGSYLILRNARIDMFKGSMRLAVNQWGKVEEGEGDFEVKVGAPAAPCCPRFPRCTIGPC